MKEKNKECEIINIKVENEQQIVSHFSFDGVDKLNKELKEFIFEKTKRTSISKDIQLNIYSKENLDKETVESTIRNEFHEEYLTLKQDLKRANIISAVLLGLGVVSLSFLILLIKLFNNVYFKTIIDIATWVFIWEAVDVFFLRRNEIKRKCILIKKIYLADIHIIKQDVEKLNEKQKTRTNTKK